MEGVASPGGNRGTAAAFVSPLQQRFNEANQRLYALREKYTEAHPDVLRTKEEIVELKAALEGGDLGGIAEASLPLTLSPENNQELVSLNMEIDYLTREEESIAQTIRDYQLRIEKSHQVEQQLVRLTDDFEMPNRPISNCSKIKQL